jgi:hypothetical protein
MKSTIEVQGTAVPVLTTKREDFISLTDMLKAEDGHARSYSRMSRALKIRMPATLRWIAKNAADCP